MQVSEQSRPRCAEYADAPAANARLATLHMVCGKIGSGKSTLARQLAAGPGTVLVSEDSWLAGLYPGEMQSVADYVRCSARLKGLMGAHVQALLSTGVSVVLDFPANTVAQRSWMRGLIQRSGAAHRLHLLDVPEQVCRTRLRLRNGAGTHPFATSDTQFDLISRHFVPPSPTEGFDLLRHAGGPPG